MNEVTGICPHMNHEPRCKLYASRQYSLISLQHWLSKYGREWFLPNYRGPFKNVWLDPFLLSALLENELSQLFLFLLLCLAPKRCLRYMSSKSPQLTLCPGRDSVLQHTQCYLGHCRVGAKAHTLGTTAVTAAWGPKPRSPGLSYKVAPKVTTGENKQCNFFILNSLRTLVITLLKMCRLASRTSYGIHNVAAMPNMLIQTQTAHLYFGDYTSS